VKAKTIKAVLRKKVDDWLASIEDGAVREAAAKNTIVTGGAIASMLLREKVSDFDIYFRDWRTAAMVAKYYVDRFKPEQKNGISCDIKVVNGYRSEIDLANPPSSGDDKAARIKVMIRSAGVANEDGTTKPYEYFESRPEGEATAYISDVMGDAGDIQDAHDQTEDLVLNQIEDDSKPRYRPVFLSSNAITLSHKVQVILRFYGEPDAIHANYDYVHCTNYWTSWDNELVLRKEALEALLTRELRYVGSKYPICSLIRLRKFIARGWSVNAGQILKAVMQISELDLKDVNVLEDQLTGVDAAYFMEVVSKLKEADPEKVNHAYLVEIIERMF